MIVKYMALGRRLLHIPLFYKIVLANALIITAETLVGGLIVISRFHSIAATNDWLLIAVLGGAGLAVSIALTSITVALTLAPLNRLQKALTEMQQGHFGARVDVGAFGDEQFDQLANAFNRMLTTLEQRSQELQRLSRDILRAHEEERARVARELHDEAAQDLTGLLARIKVLEKSRSLEEVRQGARELRQLTAQTLEDVGRIALELRPAIVDYLGLDAALCARVEELSANHSVNASLRITGVDGPMPATTESAFYRVAQEALTNIARHARAQHAHVSLRRENSWLILEVTDDGAGFDVAEVMSWRQCNLGIWGMRERMALVGGELTIESQLGKGTRLIARAPIMSEGSNGYDKDTGVDRR